MIISFIAIPGSGKTTQIRMLENYFNANDYLTVSVPGLYKRRKHSFPIYYLMKLLKLNGLRMKEVRRELVENWHQLFLIRLFLHLL